METKQMAPPPAPTLLPNEAADYRELGRRIALMAVEGEVLKILEAGCGREWFIPLEGVAHEITGIDLDNDALRGRLDVCKDLQKAIHGDLRTIEIPEGSYHVVYSSYVLEHVSGAEALLEKFFKWVAPGGIIVVRVPDRDSVHGLLTRLTPFFVHVLYYRWVQGSPFAGKAGYPPYPTVYDKVVSRAGIARFAERKGLEIEAVRLYGSYVRGAGFFRVAIPVFAKLVSFLSLGRYSAASSDITFVLRKPATQTRS